MEYFVLNSTLQDGITYSRTKTGGTSPSVSVSGTTITTVGSWDSANNYTSYGYALLSKELIGRGQKVNYTATARTLDARYNPDSYMVLYDVANDTYTKIESPYTMPSDGRTYKLGGYAFVQGFGSGSGTITYTYQLNEVGIEESNCRIKVSGSWVVGRMMIKENGSWKNANPEVKANGEWKK